MRKLAEGQRGEATMIGVRLEPALVAALDAARRPGESRGLAVRRLLGQVLAAPREQVLAELRRRGAGGALVDVPGLVRALPGLPVVAVLLELDHAGLAELRPESGVGTLAPADAALCPRGPGGVPLSYVRVR